MGNETNLMEKKLNDIKEMNEQLIKGKIKIAKEKEKKEKSSKKEKKEKKIKKDKKSKK